VAILIVVALIALGVGGVVRPASAQDAEKDRPVRGMLGGVVAQAKAKGLAEVTIHGGMQVMRTGPRSLSDLGDWWSVVVAEPVAAVTVARLDERGLTTWYTLRIDEFLRKQAVSDSTAGSRPPRGVDPPGAGQILVAVNGGDLRIQGVVVHQVGLRFETGVKYVLNVRLRSGDNVSGLAAAPDAGSAVGRDGAITPLRESSFSHSLASAGVKDLGRLREVLREPTR
jgi:hypothetical protein